MSCILNSLVTDSLQLLGIPVRNAFMILQDDYRHALPLSLSTTDKAPFITLHKISRKNRIRSKGICKCNVTLHGVQYISWRIINGNTLKILMGNALMRHQDV